MLKDTQERELQRDVNWAHTSLLISSIKCWKLIAQAWASDHRQDHHLGASQKRRSQGLPWWRSG